MSPERVPSNEVNWANPPLIIDTEGPGLNYEVTLSDAERKLAAHANDMARPELAGGLVLNRKTRRFITNNPGHPERFKQR